MKKPDLRCKIVEKNMMRLPSTMHILMSHFSFDFDSAVFPGEGGTSQEQDASYKAKNF